MNLTEFIVYAEANLAQLIIMAQGIHPFTDFPQINLWNLFMSTILVMLVMTFVPGLTGADRDDVENLVLDIYDTKEGDSYYDTLEYRDHGYMDAYQDDDDFDY